MRTVWAVRLVFLAAAAGLVLLLLASRGEAEPEDPIREVRGTTELGGDLVLKFDRAGGELRSFDVVLDGSCNDGRTVNIRWRPADNGAPARFVRHGKQVDAREESARSDAAGMRIHKVAVMRARVTDAGASGTFRFEQSFAYPGGPTIVCGSEPIGWSVRLP
jgi:hypothetical protein